MGGGWKGKTCRGLGVDHVVASSIIACWKCVTTLARASSGPSFSPASRFKSFSKFPPLESIDVLRSQTSSSCHRTKGPPGLSTSSLKRAYSIAVRIAVHSPLFPSALRSSFHDLCNDTASLPTRATTFYEASDDTANLRSIAKLEMIPWTLDRHHDTTKFEITSQVSKRYYEFWNDTTKDIMSFENFGILGKISWVLKFWNNIHGTL